MTSNIKVRRICLHCGTEFTARTTVTQYCSDTCSKRAYKARQRNSKIEISNKDMLRIKMQPIDNLKAKEFLKVKDVASLLCCSIRSVYYYINNGNINATNLGQRITRVKRSELDKLFVSQDLYQEDCSITPDMFDISDCYNLTEIQRLYSISGKGLYDLIKRNNIPKIKDSGMLFVPKTFIDNLLR